MLNKEEDLNSGVIRNLMTGSPNERRGEFWSSYVDANYRGLPSNFSTEFGKIVHSLADFGNRNTGGHENFYFDRYRTDILK